MTEEAKTAELVNVEQVRRDLTTKPLKTGKNVQQLLEMYEDAMARLAPKTLDVGRMMRIAVAITSRNPKLREATGLSLVGALMTATQMGLDIGMGLAHLVPFYNGQTKQTEIQLIPDYKGLIELVTNTGRITSIRAVPVFNDEVDSGDFIYEEGLEPKLIHKPRARSMNPEDLYAIYTVARYENGFLDVELMFANEILRIRDRARSASGPWKTDFLEMAKKTVIKRHCKRLPKSIELVTAIALDDRAAMGMPQRLQLTETESGPVVDVAPDFSDDDEGEAQPEAKRKSEGSVAMRKAAKAGDQTPPEEQKADTSLFPQDTGEVKMIGKGKQTQLQTVASESGWKMTELRAFLTRQGIEDGDVANVPASAFDSLVMKISAGGDPADEEQPGEPEPQPDTAPADDDDGILASDEDWARIRKAAKMGGRSDKEISAYLRSQGVKLNSRLPKSKVADVLVWAMGD